MEPAKTSSPVSALRIERGFAWTREKVFRAWTSPEAVKQWWGPPGYECPSAEIDLRVGGAYRLAMRQLPNGEPFFTTGVFREVTPPARLVYTWNWRNGGMPDLPETVVTVEFHAEGDSTRVVLVHDGFPSEMARDAHRDGWTGCLECLGATLAGESRLELDSVPGSRS